MNAVFSSETTTPRNRPGSSVFSVESQTVVAVVVYLFAHHFCPAADEVRHYFRYRKRMGETVRLVEQRPHELLPLNVDQTV